jgi:PAS domain S-box-containing protein
MMNRLSRDQLRNLADFLLPVLLMAVALGAASLFAHARLGDSIAEIERDTQRRLEQIAEVIAVSELLNRSHADLHGLVTASRGPQTASGAPLALEVDELRNRLDALERRFDAIAAWSGDPDAHARADGSLHAYHNVVLTLLEADTRGPQEALVDLVHAEPLHDAYIEYLNTLISGVAAEAAAANAGDIHLLQGQLDENLTGSVAVIAFTLLLATLLALRLAFNRETLAQAVRRIAQDELEPEHFDELARVAAKKDDRLGRLAQALLQFRETRLAQKDNETLLRAVIEQAPCAIELVDPVTLRFLRVNAYSRQALGYTEAEMLERTVLDIQAELPPQGTTALARQAVETGGLHFETTHRAADGRLFDASVWIRAIHLHGRDYLLGIWRDISAERSTKQKLEKFSLAIEQSPNAVVITDTEARIEYVNDAFTQTSGYTREEALGHNPRLLKSGKTPGEVYTAMWAALTRGEAWRGELINRRKDGEEYIELAQISPIRQPDGRITHYLAIKQDITEKRLLIEELERHRGHLEQLVAERSTELRAARDAAEVANRAKSEFLANMSHEIRTPLNAIIGLGHLLAKDLREDKHKARLAKITTAARHLLQIINDILDLSKIEAGRLDIEIIDFDPAAMLANTLELVREQAEQKDLKLSLELDTLPPKVRGDALRLGQIMVNFASNAVKFTPRGSIAIGGKVLAKDGDRLTVRFEVIDTGIGLERSQCERLFQPFEQADPSTTRKYGGTGLGLAISRRLTELMGGTIGVDSKPGKGSTFWIEVPLQSRPAPAGTQAKLPGAVRRTPARAQTLALTGRRILLAEDNPVNREVAVAILRETGATIDTAANGQEAVEMAKAGRYDLILMDVQMPVMDGLAATRLLRSQDALRELPIVAMTANAFNEDRQLCIDAGMNDHIPKPVEPELLCEKVARWLPPAAPGAGTPAHPESASARPAEGTLDAAALAGLASIPELDVAAGLQYVLDDGTLYLELLRLFAASGYDEMLERAIAAGDAEGAYRAAHSLKSGAATIGATALSLAAAELESRLGPHSGTGEDFTRHEPLRDAMVALAARTERLGDALRAVAHEAAPGRAQDLQTAAPAAVEADPSRVAEVLASMEQLLTLGDLSVRELLETNRDLLRAVLGERFARFEDQVGDFAFDEALAELRAASAALARPRPD